MEPKDNGGQARCSCGHGESEHLDGRYGCNGRAGHPLDRCSCLYVNLPPKPFGPFERAMERRDGRPTIAELEKILAGEPGRVTIQPNGEIRAFTCKAQPTADPPSDCDWPHCGCDPAATKVLEALHEEGLLGITALRCLKHATIPPTILPPAKTECGLCMRDEGILVGRREIASLRQTPVSRDILGALNLAVALLHDLDGDDGVEPLARAEITETLAQIDKIMEGL